MKKAKVAKKTGKKTVTRKKTPATTKSVKKITRSKVVKKNIKKTLKPKKAQKDWAKLALAFHKKHQGKISISSVVPVKNRDDLSVIYTPGVAAVSKAIAEKPERAREYTIKGRTVLVVSDGSAVLGLGNVGPEAALPVMEGKAALFKTFAGVDAFPLVLATQDPDEIIDTIMRIAPTFGGINLEDIAAPQCFYIERTLKEQLDIPVMHDDQHGTAIVVTAALINALKVVKKKMSMARIVLVGAGAAGTAIAHLLTIAGAQNILVLDRKGIISRSRSGLSEHKLELARSTNPDNESGGISEALTGADVLIGVSGPGLITAEQVALMAPGSIVFAMANPIPEIMPDEAKKGGAYIIATGRSDFPNQVNNSLVFPGIFKGALERNVPRITDETKLRAAKNLAALVAQPSRDKIIPDMFDKRAVAAVAKAVR
jgi:malate dehydrogenase (oxaloacetate-decarboxylating)